METFNSKAVGERIKQLRKMKKMTQKDLGNKFNIKQQTVGTWENGTAVISSENLNLLADYFHVSTDYLLGRPPVEHKEETDLDKLIDNAHSYDGKPITAHDRDLIKAYLHGLYADK